MSTVRFMAVATFLIGYGLSHDFSLAQTITVGTGTGTPGSVVSFPVSLQTLGFSVATVQNEIYFSQGTPIRSKASGKPDCTVNPAIGKDSTTFVFLPTGCTGSACTGARAIVASTSDTSPIPDGNQLYTCNVQIGSSSPPGIYPLVATVTSSVVAADPEGVALEALGVDGQVVVNAP
jgi:hypothetical protein